MDEKQLLVEALKEAGLVGQAQKSDAVPPHGTNALLNTAGVRPDMHSTVVRPTNITEALPVFESEYDNELFEVLTGQTADSGTNPDGTCEAPAVTGHLKTAQVTAVYGELWKGTKQIKISDHRSRKNRADVDRRLINFEGLQPGRYTPDIVGNPNLNNTVAKEFLEFSHSLTRDMSHVTIQGTTANTGSSAYSGFIKEYNGLDQWIKTGYVDVPTSVDAPALDSNVTDYANGTLDSDWYTHFANVVRTQRQLAGDTGMGDVVWALLIHPSALYPLIDTVSCAFPSVRCAIGGSTDTGRRLDVTVVNELRNNMYAQMYIPVDNVRVPVIWDHNVAATYDQPSDTWTSDFMLVPLMSGSGEALTYMEYLPFNTSIGGPLFNTMGTNYDYMVLNNGMYLCGRTVSYNCFSFHFNAKFRLIMRTPWLAARIDDVNYTSNTPIRSPIPGDQYYKNGGQYVRS